MKKISKSKIITTYAEALYSAAEEKKAVDKVLKDVKILIQVLREDSSIIKYLSNPVWQADSKAEALMQAGKKLGLDKETVSCLEIISANSRFSELLSILETFEHIWYVKNGYVEVSVQSVQELNAVQEKKLSTALEKMLSKKVVLSYEIRPEILGGLIVKFGSSMIDDSIRGKLNRLEIMMKGGQ